MARYHDKSLEFFSVLPESVIHHILSFLPFKHIGRTSVLSKAWNRIWLNYPNIHLVLHEALYKRDRIANFNLAHLQKFKICSCRFANEDGLSRIICGCPKIEFLKSRLKSFKIVCNLEPKRIRIFAPSLETLYSFGIKPCSIDFACCTRLKRLGLGGDIDSADFVHIQKFLSKLCYIEEFKLLCYRGLDKFQISSSRLKRLIIEDRRIDLTTALFTLFSPLDELQVLHQRLSIDESIMCSYSECKLVPIEEVKHKKDPAFKSFLRMQSKNGYHCAGIIFIK
ncbi:hypothetical protein DM860_009866 [Cuscuta australis]|uniref:F-box domain-containing protein n=1 Tax=Cuscuta australis TaxID=267555 RepID=A0A328DC71_9ASTE|nr:hypothetical protein DM860_009866 [Cuscuta australis]